VGREGGVVSEALVEWSSVFRKKGEREGGKEEWWVRERGKNGLSSYSPPSPPQSSHY